jgi:hypothetical protein
MGVGLVAHAVQAQEHKGQFEQIGQDLFLEEKRKRY